jgi:hypothetical protein
MADSHPSVAAALRRTSHLLRTRPERADVLRRGSLQDPARLAFIHDPAIKPWLEERQFHPDGNQERIEWLIDTVEAWQGGGQAAAIASLYEARLEDGTLAWLHASDRLVYQAVCALAVLDGPSVLAGGDYVATLLRVQYGASMTGRTVRNALRRLHARGLLELHASTGRYASNRADIGPALREHGTSTAAPSDEAVQALTVGVDAYMALLSYRMEVRASRGQAGVAVSVRRAPSSSEKAAPEAATVWAGGTGDPALDRLLKGSSGHASAHSGSFRSLCSDQYPTAMAAARAPVST